MALNYCIDCKINYNWPLGNPEKVVATCGICRKQNVHCDTIPKKDLPSQISRDLIKLMLNLKPNFIPGPENMCLN